MCRQIAAKFKNGPIKTRNSPFACAIAAKFESMAAKKEMTIERRLRAFRTNKQLLQSTTDNSPAVVYVKDQDGRYLLVNQRYEELFHVSQEEMLRKTDYDLFPKESADAFRAVDQQVLSSGTRAGSRRSRPTR
jgi:PAS domain-containing protein